MYLNLHASEGRDFWWEGAVYANRIKQNVSIILKMIRSFHMNVSYQVGCFHRTSLVLKLWTVKVDYIWISQ